MGRDAPVVAPYTDSGLSGRELLRRAEESTDEAECERYEDEFLNRFVVGQRIRAMDTDGLPDHPEVRIYLENGAALRFPIVDGEFEMRPPRGES